MKLIATARTPDDARQKRFELAEQMAQRGLYPRLLIGLVPAAAPDDQERWGVWYAPEDGREA